MRLTQRSPMLWPVAIGLFLTIASACASNTPGRATEAATEEPAPESLKQCLRALQSHSPRSQVSESVAMEKAERATRACGALWEEEGCSDAWSASLRLSAGERAAHVVSACKAAYCPSIEQNAELCEADTTTLDLTDDERPWLAMWQDFNHTILARSLGPGNAVEAAHFSRTLLLFVSMTSGRSHGPESSPE